MTAQVAGWGGETMQSEPLYWLMTLPLRCLPAGWMAPALNILSAILAALTLGILARSLELAAWDRPLETLEWRSRLPLLLACVICGLEYNFWKEATAGTGEMLQLLLLAAAIGCLCKYRVTCRLRWMRAAALIWGLGMAENWMMVFTLPIFVASLFWLGKFDMLSLKTILRLALAGLAGFLVFFTLPLARSVALHVPLQCCDFCLYALKAYKSLLGTLWFEFWHLHRMELLVVTLFFFVPIFPIIFRGRDEGTRHKRSFDRLMLWGDRGKKAAFLLVCVWLAFDPLVGPRWIVLQQTGIALPLLSLDYLAALCAGFLAGDLLLALLAERDRRHHSRRFLERISRHATPILAALLIVAAAGLLVRNAPAILLANREPVAQFGELALKSLPPGGGMVLSDQPAKLQVFQATAACQGNSRWLAVNLQRLSRWDYRQRLSKTYPGEWFTEGQPNLLNQQGVVAMAAQFARTGHVYYLEDDCGTLFDTVYLDPVGSVFTVKPAPDDVLHPPRLSAATISSVEQFWNGTTPQLEAIEGIISPRSSRFDKTLHLVLACGQIQPVPPAQTRELADWYSVALNDWGVRLQQAGQITAAHHRFIQALMLNTNNIAAQMNLVCNSNLVAGNKMNLSYVRGLAAELGDFNRLTYFIYGYGMVDQPSFCYVLGVAFLDAGLPRQALEQFLRAQTLAPDVAAPKLAAADLYNHFGFGEQARRLIAEARGDMPLAQQNSLNTELSVLQAESWFAQTNAANAGTELRSLLNEHPGDVQAVSMAMRAYVSFGDYSNALRVVNSWLAANPDDLNALMGKGAVCEKLGRADDAIATYNHALSLTNAPLIRLLRDQSYVEAGKLDAAEGDLLQMDKTATNHLDTDLALAQIASRRHETNDTLVWLQRCLTNVPANSVPYQWLVGRINALKSPGTPVMR